MTKNIAILFLVTVVFSFVNRQLVAQDDPNVYAKLKHGDRDIVSVTSVAFTPDGKTLAAGYSLADANPVRSKKNAIANNLTGEVVIWETATKKKQAVIECGPGSVRFVAYSPDGKLLAVAHSDFKNNTENVKILEMPNRNERHQITLKQTPQSIGFISAIAFSPDSKTLAIGTTYEGDVAARLMLWDLATGKEKRSLKGGKDSISSLSFSADGKLLVSVSDNVVQVWDMNTEKERNSFPVERGYLAAPSPDTRAIAVVTLGSRKYPGIESVTLRDLQSGEERVDLKCKQGATAMLFTPDSKKLITGLGGLIKTYDVQTGKSISTFDGPPINCLAFTAHGNLLASGNQTGTVWLWDISPVVENKK